MSARYRIVHFTPAPLSGQRVPLAALVTGAGQAVQVVRAPHLPGPGCLGGMDYWATMQMVLEDLETVGSFEALPMSLGPHVSLATQREIPASVLDPASWVESHVLPRRPENPDDERETTPYATRREVVGYRFFKTWRVENYVERHFKGASLGLNTDYAGQISHFVPGSRELLLMEPVVGSRTDVRRELREISQSFLAWSKVFERQGSARLPKFVAYVFSGVNSAVQEARELLSMAQADVIDLEVPNERDRFLQEIRRIGRTNPQAGGLPLN